MATETLGLNKSFPIYKSDGTAFYDLVLHKATYDSVVMSLGDKITGDVYYKDNTLAVTMQEYIEYNGVHFVLVNPPTVVREGMAADNSGLNGMTKYSFEFYHPMCALSNFSFNDVAVTSDELKYLSQNKKFAWIGNCFDFLAKLNKNLQNTQWVVVSSGNEESEEKMRQLSDVLTFDNNYISDALKTAYDTWAVPFVIDTLQEGEYSYIDTNNNEIDYYSEGKRFVIVFGLPSNEILDDNDEEYTFQFGKGVGLKNNSRTTKNNKIVTRISGCGSERNIPWGYPQIPWYGNQDWEYTVDNDLSKKGSYPIYNAIYGGSFVKLIKHPYTRKTLMPSVYSQTVFNKVSPYLSDGTTNPNFDPDLEIVDYYDADNSYPNPIVADAPSFEIHQFEDIYPQLGEKRIIDAVPYDEEGVSYYTYSQWYTYINNRVATVSEYKSGWQLDLLVILRDVTCFFTPEWAEIHESAKIISYNGEWDTGSCNASIVVKATDNFVNVTIVSTWYNTTWRILQPHGEPIPEWDDSYDIDNDKYVQGYFTITLPQLDFDIYACASITENMQINMRGGACIGCTFDIQVDWEDYKKNFYDADGNFAPTGSQRDYTAYPDSSQGQITVIVQKDIDTFGTIMPDLYRKPKGESSVGANDGDQFVILGISLPISYVTNAEARLSETMKQYMLENNVHYYDYPLKFDEYFLATHTNILAQMRNNTVVKFQYGEELPMKLYIKQMTIKYGDKPLPQYDITLTDDVEIVLNKIGQVTDDVSRVRVQLSELQKYYSENIMAEIRNKLSRVADDIAEGKITFNKGLESIAEAIFDDNLRSREFVSGFSNGKGWRIDNRGNAELESLRVRSFLEVVELLINRMRAQEGDTLFTDNDQIDKVEVIEESGNVSYILSLKEKWEGYITSQSYGNILKGVINTLAAKEGGVSDESTNNTDKQGSDTGGNLYYTSWMRVIGTPSTDSNLGANQIKVVLYGDNETPSRKNFAPCELMSIARWGNILDPNESGISDTEKARRRSLQSMFMLSNTDGRITRLVGVNSPILSNTNYGATLGELPDFVKNYANVAERLSEGADYLYAQGIVVEDFIKVDRQGRPKVEYIDEGEWIDGSDPNVTPQIGSGIYLRNEYNEESGQYETHDVWHNGNYWRCLQHQPVTIGGTTTYYEPTDSNSAYWQKLLVSGNSNKTIYSYNSSTPTIPSGYEQDDQYVPNGWSVSPLSVSASNKNVYISTRIKDNGTWGNWSTPALFARYAEDGTSISIKGVAIAIDEYPTTPQEGDIVLWQGTSDDDIDVYENGRWEGYVVDLGVGYIYENDLWVKSSEVEPKWTNVGQIKGDDGAAGKNTATVFIYKRAASINSNDKPATLTYDFTQGTLTGTTFGWSANIPTSDGNPCWVRQTFVQSEQASTTISTSAWGNAYKLVEDGEKGEKGEQGQKGEMGRAIYFAGTLSEVGGTTFTATDTQAPYIDVETGTVTTPNCYVYKGDNGSDIVFPSTAQDYATSSDWELMITDFKYLITEAIFSNNAKLGSSYISRDWQISTYGTLYDANDTAYIIDAISSVTIDDVTYTKNNAFTLFDPNYPNSSKSGSINFAPNYAINFLTGAGQFARGEIHWDDKGNTTINGALFYNRTVNAKFGSRPKLITSTEEFYTLENGTYMLKTEDDYSSFQMLGNIYIIGGIQYDNGSGLDKYYQISLPPAKLCYGLQITFFNNTAFYQDSWTSREIGLPLRFLVEFDNFNVAAIEGSGTAVCYNGFYNPFSLGTYISQVDSYKDRGWDIVKSIRKITFTAGINPNSYKDGQGSSDEWRDENCISWILTDYET